MNEFELINYLTCKLKKDKDNIVKGIGDDTAVIYSNSNEYYLLTTDSLVENIHFSLHYNISYKKLWYFLGWKSIAVNISDIYAMGGYPTCALISLHIPPGIKEKNLKLLYSGIEKCAEKYKITIAVGNISKTGKEMIIAVFMAGAVKKEELLLRENARVSDHIYIQNGIGNSRAGLELLNQGTGNINSLLLSHLQPQPVSLGNIMQDKYRINSAIDISDGLLQDMNHVLKSSKKGAEIYTENIPVSHELKKLFPDKYLEFILNGGEDYKLIFTSPDLIKKNNISIIGKIIKKKGLYLIDSTGKKRINNPEGYRHY